MTQDDTSKSTADKTKREKRYGDDERGGEEEKPKLCCGRWPPAAALRLFTGTTGSSPQGTSPNSGTEGEGRGERGAYGVVATR